MVCPTFVILGIEISVQAQQSSRTAEESGTISTSVGEMTGVDVSGLTNVDSIGFLSKQKVRSWGHIFSSESEKVILCEGDTVYIRVEKERPIKHGDQFIVYRESTLLKHPLTKKKMGYIISVLGRIVIKNQLKDLVNGRLFIAEVVDSYREVRLGDQIFTYEPISPCIQPLPLDREITTNIVAVKDQNELIARFSVIYLERGYNHGIRKGNLFEIVKKTPALPDVVLGHVLVLEARPDTSTCVVIDAKKEFSSGALIRSINWNKAQLVFSSIPECRVE